MISSANHVTVLDLLAFVTGRVAHAVLLGDHVIADYAIVVAPIQIHRHNNLSCSVEHRLGCAP